MDEELGLSARTVYMKHVGLCLAIAVREVEAEVSEIRVIFGCISNWRPVYDK